MAIKAQNTPEVLHMVYDVDFIHGLNTWCEQRIEEIKNEMLNATDFNKVSFLQGGVRELKRLKELKADVLNKKD